MSKVEVSTVAEILKKNQLSPALLRQVIEEINLATAKDSPVERPPAIKKQWVIVISDPDGLLPRTDFAGWVLQLPEADSVATTLDRIFRSAYDFNATKKGRLLPVKTVGETLENVPAKFFREADLWVKTRTPVLMLRTDNIVPGTDNQMPLPESAA